MLEKLRVPTVTPFARSWGGGVVRDGLKEIFTLIFFFFRMHGRNLAELVIAVPIL